MALPGCVLCLFLLLGAPSRSVCHQCGNVDCGKKLNPPTSPSWIQEWRGPPTPRGPEPRGVAATDVMERTADNWVVLRLGQGGGDTMF